ncbi:MAG TPA: dTMP kinase [Methanomassiliicoccales archaeon]|nr:dTMP kinase [Methanomassiliicoccales archaeon]
MSGKGVFIVLEGIDGTGKSTISKKLKAWLEEKGREVVLNAEPTGDWLGAAVRRANNEDLDPRTESLLFTADRCQHTLRIEEMLKQGKVVICDRYYGSTVAYQGAALEKDMGDNAVSWLLNLNGPVIRHPDVTILLTSEPKVAMRRVGNRGVPSKFEREGYLGKVQDNYLMLAREAKWTVIDSSGKLGEVLESVKKAVQAYV